MKGRWIVLGAALGFVLALTLGFAHGSTGWTTGGGPGSMGSMMDGTPSTATMDAMHDSAAMRQLHDQMPAELAAQCDALHEQMSQMMEGTSGMGGMMGGTAPWTGSAGPWGSHADHHPTGS